MSVKTFVGYFDQAESMLHPPAETVNHYLLGAGEFSTGVDIRTSAPWPAPGLLVRVQSVFILLRG
jgi:hypothetical protein